MKAKDGPGPVDWMRAVADSDLGKREKAVLWAMIRYVDWGLEETSCYPSIPTLAQASGWCERAVQDAMKELERLGIVHVSDRCTRPGWKTWTRWLSFPALIAHTPARPAGVDGETPARTAEVKRSQPRTPCAHPSQQVQGPPAGRAPEPRRACAQSCHRPSIEPTNELEAGAHATDGMDGTQADATRKRQALRALKEKGVQGKNLDRLSACPQLTPEVIEREWQRIRSSPDVRDAPAVLVRALGEFAGIKLGSQQALAGMDPTQKRALLESQARLEQRRRKAQLAAP